MNPQEILPEPEVEKTSENLGAADQHNEKQATQRTEKKSGSPTGAGAVSAVAVDDAQSGVAGVQQGATDLGVASTAATTQLDVPEIAEDNDLIEKEWVKKAKDIVHATTGDPYSQNKQINRMKVDYIKKRYNKDVKHKE